jgi:hypothetical protein
MPLRPEHLAEVPKVVFWHAQLIGRDGWKAIFAAPFNGNDVTVHEQPKIRLLPHWLTLPLPALSIEAFYRPSDGTVLL